MADYPVMPLFTDAYLGDTMDLSLEEHGAYLKLLMIAWRSGDCSLPDDDKRLAIMLGITTKRWREKIRPSIEHFWTSLDGKLVQKKQKKVRRNVENQVAQKSKAGKASAEAKALKNNDDSSTVVEMPLQRRGNGAATNQNQSQIDSESPTDSKLTEQPIESGITPDAPNGANGKIYVFEGKIFRLNSKDFEQWKRAYSHIDLMAELFDLDNYFDRELKGEDRKKIFHRMSGAVRKRNQRAMDESNANPCTPGKYKKLDLF